TSRSASSRSPLRAPGGPTGCSGQAWPWSRVFMDLLTDGGGKRETPPGARQGTRPGPAAGTRCACGLRATLDACPWRIPFAARMDAAPGVGRLCRDPVRGGMGRRPLSAVSATLMAAAGRLQPGARGVLLVLDLLRRGRLGGAQRHRLPADLSGPAAAVAVRLAHPGTSGADRA